MSTPEKPRPSLDDTLARIDQALAEPVANPPCLRCARQALLGSPYCAAHKRIPREMIEDLGPDAPIVEPVTRDGNTFTVNTPGVYEMTWNPGSSGEPSVAERALQRALENPPDTDWVTFEKPGHLPGAPGPTCPGCQADAERPGWLARALHRLFT